jgi:hypothetical protein
VARALSVALKENCVSQDGTCYAFADDTVAYDGDIAAEVDGEFSLLVLARAAIAALDQAEAVMPIEAVTEEMIEAGATMLLKCDQGGQNLSRREKAERIYTAMRSAAPPAPVQDDDAEWLLNHVERGRYFHSADRERLDEQVPA